MNTAQPKLVLCIGLTVAMVCLGLDTSVDAEEILDPLAPFARLVGGEWHLEGTYQTFEWGVGKKSVKASSYFVIDGKPKLVSECVWFWHPGEKRIKGYATAIDMPVAFFEYTTDFEGHKMVNELKSYTADGTEEIYTETWEFVDANRYVWTLFNRTPEGLEKAMGGEFTRK